MKSFFSRDAVIAGAQAVLNVLQEFRGKFAVGFLANKQLSPEWLCQTLMEHQRNILALEYDNHVLKATLDAVILAVGDDAQEDIAAAVQELLEQKATVLRAHFEEAQKDAGKPKLVTGSGGLAVPKNRFGGNGQL